MTTIESTSKVAPCSASNVTDPLSGCFKVVGFDVLFERVQDPEKPSTLKHPLSGFCFWCRVFPARECGTSVALRYSYPLHEQAKGETVGELPEPSGRPKGCKSGKRSAMGWLQEARSVSGTLGVISTVKAALCSEIHQKAYNHETN